MLSFTSHQRLTLPTNLHLHNNYVDIHHGLSPWIRKMNSIVLTVVVVSHPPSATQDRQDNKHTRSTTAPPQPASTPVPFSLMHNDDQIPYQITALVTKPQRISRSTETVITTHVCHTYKGVNCMADAYLLYQLLGMTSYVIQSTLFGSTGYFESHVNNIYVHIYVPKS